MTVLTAGASPVSEEEDGNVIDATPVAPIEPVTDANPDVSSTSDEGAKEPLSLLDVVKSAVEPVKEPEASPTPEGEKVEPAVEGEAVAAEPAAEDDANLPFHNHPRWKSVLAERDSYRESHENYSKITDFMGTHGLVSEEVAEGFEVMAQLKSGFSGNHEALTKALEWFEPRVTMIREALGHELPTDILQRLEDGLIDDDTAKELASARASAALIERNREVRTAQTEEDRIASEVQAAGLAMKTAVEGWETRIKASDPDYSKKAQAVEDACLAIVGRTGKRPTNAAEAMALADEAYQRVNASFSAALPKPRTITPDPTAKSVTAIAAPSTLREAVEAGLARSK